MPNSGSLTTISMAKSGSSGPASLPVFLLLGVDVKVIMPRKKVEKTRMLSKQVEKILNLYLNAVILYGQPS